MYSGYIALMMDIAPLDLDLIVQAHECEHADLLSRDLSERQTLRLRRGRDAQRRSRSHPTDLTMVEKRQERSLHDLMTRRKEELDDLRTVMEEEALAVQARVAIKARRADARRAKRRTAARLTCRKPRTVNISSAGPWHVAFEAASRMAQDDDSMRQHQCAAFLQAETLARASMNAALDEDSLLLVIMIADHISAALLAQWEREYADLTSKALGEQQVVRLRERRENRSLRRSRTTSPDFFHVPRRNLHGREHESRCGIVQHHDEGLLSICCAAEASARCAIHHEQIRIVRNLRRQWVRPAPRRRTLESAPKRRSRCAATAPSAISGPRSPDAREWQQQQDVLSAETEQRTAIERDYWSHTAVLRSSFLANAPRQRKKKPGEKRARAVDPPSPISDPEALKEGTVRTFMGGTSQGMTVRMTWRRCATSAAETWLGYVVRPGGRYSKVTWTHTNGDAADEHAIVVDGQHFTPIRDPEGDIAEEPGTLPPSPALGTATETAIILGICVIEDLDVDQESQNAAAQERSDSTRSGAAARLPADGTSSKKK
jgi:hypothetical protein